MTQNTKIWTETMPHHYQFETVKQQCKSFEELGCIASLKIATDSWEYGEPRIIIAAGSKRYFLSDPDWNIIIAQLAQLYRTLTCYKELN